ncbi:MAG: VCBS repeat-containing protein [Planctomycetota bacterium]|jgi:hypothetical protein
MHTRHVVLSLALGVCAAGPVSLLPAQHQLYTFNGNAGYDELGSAVSSAGDVDKDGYPDIIVGAVQVGGGLPGMARVYSGHDGRLLFTVVGDGAGDAFGHSVSGAGDVNKDGYDDVIVGASQEFC